MPPHICTLTTGGFAVVVALENVAVVLNTGRGVSRQQVQVAVGQVFVLIVFV